MRPREDCGQPHVAWLVHRAAVCFESPAHNHTDNLGPIPRHVIGPAGRTVCCRVTSTWDFDDSTAGPPYFESDMAMSIIDLLNPTAETLASIDAVIEAWWAKLELLESIQKSVRASLGVADPKEDDEPIEADEAADEDDDEEPVRKPTPAKRAGGSGGKRKSPDEWRMAIALNLRLNGASKGSQIMATLGVCRASFVRAIEHEWFEQLPDKRWQLSPTGKTDAPQL